MMLLSGCDDMCVALDIIRMQTTKTKLKYEYYYNKHTTYTVNILDDMGGMRRGGFALHTSILTWRELAAAATPTL